MKKILVLLLFLTGVGLFGENSEVENNVLDVVKKIENAYKDVKVLDADFEQIFYHKAYKKKKKSSGNVVFTKDLKMKWSYLTPEKKYIISNGKTLWIYEPENEQAFKTSVKDTELQAATKFLLGKTDILKNYNLSLQGDKTLVLKPKKESNYKIIYLYLNDAYMVEKTKMIDNFDNENTIKYKNIKINKLNLSDDFFNFIPPDNVEIIEKDK